MVAVRYGRFNAAMIAAMLYNARPGIEDTVDVWDFIPGYAKDPQDVEREKMTRSVRQSVRVAFSRMRSMTVEQVRKEAAAMIARMQNAETADAEQIVRAVFQEVIQQPFDER